MKYVYRGRNLDISQSMKEITEKKCARLSRFFRDDATVYVTYRSENKKVAAEVTVPMQGTAPIRAEASAEDKFVALDAALDRLERQVLRYRKKLAGRARSEEYLKSTFFSEAEQEVAEVDEKMEVRRIKKVQVKPMDVSEACLEMELLGHDFFAFANIETGRVNIVYRRKEENTYGLLEIE